MSYKIRARDKKGEEIFSLKSYHTREQAESSAREIFPTSDLSREYHAMIVPWGKNKRRR